MFEKDYNANAAREISNNGKDWTWWCSYFGGTHCRPYTNNYAKYIDEARKHFYPKVTSHSVSKTSINLGESVKIYYSVSDDVGLDRVELWRTTDKSGSPDGSNWKEIKRVSISGTTYSGNFDDSTDSPGVYWYGIHVIDNSGAPEAWNDERNSRTGGTPGVFGPIRVEVSPNPTTPTLPTHIRLTAPWTQGQWWQPSTYYEHPPKNALDFNRVTNVRENWPYGDEVKDFQEPIRAAHDGIVVKVANDPKGYGNYVDIQSSENPDYFTRYAHLYSVSVNKSMRVAAGDEIGECGETGEAKGSHLHFELRHKTQGAIPILEIDGQRVEIDWTRYDSLERYLGKPIQSRGSSALTIPQETTGISLDTTSPISEVMKGDVNGDNQITVVDALFVSLYNVGLKTLKSEQLVAADVNCDGNVNTVDALLISQYTVGLRTDFCSVSP